ncbi:RNA-binding S4 domain-containing protein [Amycolatopsis sp. NPDC023774]|uniref:RNA-binding S4 domain-containing protein n=1 Tax=Amycolatopsis sp. NPDC023774 TaxID=3155015 RepID=UPI0033D67948
MSEPVRDVSITGEPIRLGQFLKLAGLAEDGAHAKDLIENEEVTVNDEVETRRGRQLSDGDVVAVGDDRGRVTLAR